MVYIKNVEGVVWEAFSISVMKGNELHTTFRQNE